MMIIREWAIVSPHLDNAGRSCAVMPAVHSRPALTCRSHSLTRCFLMLHGSWIQIFLQVLVCSLDNVHCAFYEKYWILWRAGQCRNRMAVISLILLDTIRTAPWYSYALRILRHTFPFLEELWRVRNSSGHAQFFSTMSWPSLTDVGAWITPNKQPPLRTHWPVMGADFWSKNYVSIKQDNGASSDQ